VAERPVALPPVGSGVLIMPNYRISVVSEEGRISARPHITTCDTDQEAIQQALQWVSSRDVELWEGPRLVTRLRSGIK
jgi:hypothetical protein